MLFREITFDLCPGDGYPDGLIRGYVSTEVRRRKVSRKQPCLMRKLIRGSYTHDLIRQIQRGADAQVQVYFHCFTNFEVLYVVCSM